jgi:hypothetical protein
VEEQGDEAGEDEWDEGGPDAVDAKTAARWDFTVETNTPAKIHALAIA